MQIVVVGANGFLGSHFVDALVAAGHRVVAVDRFSRRRSYDLRPEIEVKTDDPAESELIDLLPSSDAVLDFLGSSGPLRSLSEPRPGRFGPVPLSTKLIDACVKYRVSQYYFSSSGGAIYGSSEGDGNREADETGPTSPYGEAKLELENLLETRRAQGALSSTVWRFSNVYGPRQDSRRGQGLVAAAFHSYFTGDVLRVMGGGEMVRDYIYVDDAIRLALNFLGNSASHAVYNIGTGVGTSINDLLSNIESVIGRPLRVDSVPVPLGLVNRSVVNIDRLAAEFGVRPVFSLADGLQATWSWTRRQHEGKRGSNPYEGLRA
jgi:UDP-glucose 4-epimerase